MKALSKSMLGNWAIVSSEVKVNAKLRNLESFEMPGCGIKTLYPGGRVVEDGRCANENLEDHNRSPVSCQ